MKEEALFCDGNAAYVKPPEPEMGGEIRLMFRTAKDDPVKVALVSSGESVYLTKEESRGQFDYYGISRRLNEAAFFYHFEISDGEESVIYNRLGVVTEADAAYDFAIFPGFSVPDWTRGAVMYQIFTDRFCNGDLSNDVVSGEYRYLGEPVVFVSDWDKCPEAEGAREFYGGDLKGVMEKLNYLQELGVEVLYFNPLFVSPSNHKYDTQDYEHIDPHFGAVVEDEEAILPPDAADNSKALKYRQRTCDPKNLLASDQLFISLVEEAHKRGMRVILDGVFNHCGSFHKWMDREKIYEETEKAAPGAYISADSPYHDYFRFRNEDADAWPDNDSYEGWWDFKTLPKLNYEDAKALEEEILRLAAKWVSPPFNADGWRLDVAADLGHSNEYNHEFWRKFRRAVKEANPQAVILAEFYGSAREWLTGDQWDTLMNYDAFMDPVSFFLTGMEKHSDAFYEERIGNGDWFVSEMKKHMADLPPASLMSAMNELSNHDHSRFLTRTNHKVGRVDELGSLSAGEGTDMAVMRQGVVMQMTWMGAPTVYYGDEAGVCGFTDPDNRRTYPWGHEDKGLLEFTREMIHLHKKSRALKEGSLHLLTWGENLVAYARETREEQMVVIVYTGEEQKDLTISVWPAEVPAEGSMQRLVYTCSGGYTTCRETVPVTAGEIEVSMEPHSAAVLKTLK